MARSTRVADRIIGPGRAHNKGVDHCVEKIAECACLTSLKRSIMVGDDRLASPPTSQVHPATTKVPIPQGPFRPPVTVDEGDVPMSTASVPEQEVGRRDPMKAALSGWIGSALEY